MFHNWWRNLLAWKRSKSGFSGNNKPRKPSSKARYAACLEQLEDRVVPSATKYFLNTAISGPQVNTIAAGRATTVPVYVDVATLGGAGGIQAANIFLKYDPAVLSIGSSDIKLGSLLSPNSSAYSIARI